VQVINSVEVEELIFRPRTPTYENFALSVVFVRV